MGKFSGFAKVLTSEDQHPVRAYPMIITKIISTTNKRLYKNNKKSHQFFQLFQNTF